MKTTAIILFIYLIGYNLGWSQSLQETQYAAYLKAGKVLWESSIDKASAEFGSDSFQAAMASYGLLNNTMAHKDEATFDENVDEVVDLLKSIIKSNPEWGEPKAVLSSVYGLKMAYSPMKGMIYGSKSSSLITTAIKQQPESALVQKLYGAYKLYTPGMFGGDASESVIAFTKAVELYEKQSEVHNWLYLDSLVHLAMALRKSDQRSASITVLEKAVSEEPQFTWAQNILNSYRNDQ